MEHWIRLGTSITISRIAKELGLTAATVSKVLNGKGHISPGTIERVRKFASEMNYLPNSLARALRTKVNNTVGVFIRSNIVYPWYNQLVSALEAEFYRRGFSMLLALGQNNPEKSISALRSFTSGQVCGILAGPFGDKSDCQKFLSPVADQGIPLVLFNNQETVDHNFIAIDQEAGARLAVNHLISLGHRRIVYLGGPEYEQKQSINTRTRAYVMLMEAHGLEPECITFSKINRRFAYDITREILQHASPAQLPTAFFCHNDDVALGAMQALMQAGIRIPEDISITGFDDLEEDIFGMPKLTTVGGIMENLVMELVNTLEYTIQRSQGGLIQKFILPKLISRFSTAQCKGIA